MGSEPEWVEDVELAPGRSCGMTLTVKYHDANLQHKTLTLAADLHM